MTRFALHFLLLTLWFLSGIKGAAWGRSAGYDAYGEGSISGSSAYDPSAFADNWVQTAGLRRLPETAASARDAIREEINRQFTIPSTPDEARPQARSGYLHALYDFVSTFPFIEQRAAILEEIATIQGGNYTDLQDERSREAWASIFEGVYWDFLTEGLGPALGMTGTVTRIIGAERATLSAANTTAGFGPRLGPKGVVPGRHNANVTVRDASGNIVHHERVVSGGMTPAQKDLGFPLSSNATHTEAQAVMNTSIPYGSGFNMTITGQRAPCPLWRDPASQAESRQTGG